VVTSRAPSGVKRMSPSPSLVAAPANIISTTPSETRHNVTWLGFEFQAAIRAPSRVKAIGVIIAHTDAWSREVR
jgi:hypothetical protein